MSVPSPRAGRGTLIATLCLLMLPVLAWLRGDVVRDDRGSDSSEKSLMIILAIAAGSAVSAAALAYIATKTALFK